MKIEKVKKIVKVSPLLPTGQKQRQGRNRSSRPFRLRMKMNKGKINSKGKKVARLEVDFDGWPPTTPLS